MSILLRAPKRDLIIQLFEWLDSPINQKRIFILILFLFLICLTSKDIFGIINKIKVN